MATSYEIPYFLQNKSVDDIHQIMRLNMPDDIDISEGSLSWDLTRTTAIVASMICQYILNEAIQLTFPEWSYGIYLDELAKGRGITRRAATRATGTVTIDGAEGTVIPTDSVFSTASVDSNPSISYKTKEEAKIPAEGTIDIDVYCTQFGTIGNTAANTIIFNDGRISGITAVINKEAITGGTEQERDDVLSVRILEYDATQGQSFVGNPGDYKRWAKSVGGVGECVVLEAQDNSGMVTLYLIDSNGSPANEEIQTAVYNYIMHPENPATRLAPINALLTVTAPTVLTIGISATVELVEQYTIDIVKTAFLAQIKKYLTTASEQGEIKYSKIGSLLSDTDGVSDYNNLKIGIKTGDTVAWDVVNIAITQTQLPMVVVDDLVLTSGTVE